MAPIMLGAGFTSLLRLKHLLADDGGLAGGQKRKPSLQVEMITTLMRSSQVITVHHFYGVLCH